MARRTKDAPGRVTPKKSAASRPTDVGRPASGRYTAPVPVHINDSPRWVPILMLALFGVGILGIVLNYLGVLPGGAHNYYLLGGLGAIVLGFVAATQYR
jgi:hypothetical protein